MGFRFGWQIAHMEPRKRPVPDPEAYFAQHGLNSADFELNAEPLESDEEMKEGEDEEADPNSDLLLISFLSFCHFNVFPVSIKASKM